jgi:hypothetical protein
MKKGTFFGLAAALSIVGPVALGVAPANAVVYCKAVGIPKGCVARPAGAAVVHPATRPVVYCKRVGVPKGCVMR